MKRYVIGDIHGMNVYLQKALDIVDFDHENDFLISLGDIVDRGPDVYDCVEILNRVKNKVVCLGNHDAWFLEFLNSGQHPQDWLQGGYNTAESYCRRADKEIFLSRMSSYETTLTFEDIPLSHIKFFRQMVPYHIMDKKLFVHAGYDRKKSIHQQPVSVLTWDRNLIQQVVSYMRSNTDPDSKFNDVNEFDRVFIGHTPTIFWTEKDILKDSNKHAQMTKPIMGANVINLDTGAVYGGALTIMNIDTLEYWQIKE